MSAVDCPVQVKHMKGDVDPRTEHNYDSEQTAVLLSVQSQNLLHNFVKDEGEVGGAKLPGEKTDILQLTVEELKAMMTVHTGNLTGDNGKSLKKAKLQRYLKAYMKMKKAHPTRTVYFDCSREGNGIFARLTLAMDVQLKMLTSLVSCCEYEQRQRVSFTSYSMPTKGVNLWKTSLLFLSRHRR